MLSRPQNTLLALLALSSFAQAGRFENPVNEIVRRQDVDTGRTPTPTPSPSTTGTTSETETTRSVTTTTSSSRPNTQTSTSSSSSSTSGSMTSSSSSSTSSGSSTESSTTSTSPETKTTPSTTPSPTIIRITQTRTVDGTLVTSISESTSTIIPSPTNAAELNQNSDSSGGGMTPKTRSTVIGVVVGIGGAILLGGLAVVAWRIWGRKKSVEDGDDFGDYSRPDTGAEKTHNSSSGGSSNPFQSTLENYHNPAKVNASSNF